MRKKICITLLILVTIAVMTACETSKEVEESNPSENIHAQADTSEAKPATIELPVVEPTDEEKIVGIWLEIENEYSSLSKVIFTEETVDLLGGNSEYNLEDGLIHFTKTRDGEDKKYEMEYKFFDDGTLYINKYGNPARLRKLVMHEALDKLQGAWAYVREDGSFKTVTFSKGSKYYNYETDLGDTYFIEEDNTLVVASDHSDYDDVTYTRTSFEFIDDENLDLVWEGETLHLEKFEKETESLFGKWVDMADSRKYVYFKSGIDYSYWFFLNSLDVSYHYFIKDGKIYTNSYNKYETYPYTLTEDGTLVITIRGEDRRYQLTD